MARMPLYMRLHVPAVINQKAQDAYSIVMGCCSRGTRRIKLLCCCGAQAPAGEHGRPPGGVQLRHLSGRAHGLLYSGWYHVGQPISPNLGGS